MIIYCGVAGAHLANSSHFNGRPSSFFSRRDKNQRAGKKGREPRKTNFGRLTSRGLLSVPAMVECRTRRQKGKPQMKPSQIDYLFVVSVFFEGF